MEIEAKFAVPDLATFQRLQAVDHVAGFSLSAHQVQQVHDTYLDTEDRVILANGYACRRRETELEVLITLKALVRAAGAIHRRQELEISLSKYEPPEAWPESAVRSLVLEATGGASLMPLFDLRQTRVFRRMRHGELLVAQLSLDNVRVVANRRKRIHFELEVELAPQGTGSDMAEIVTYLQDEWNLAPEPHSKFERALAFLDEGEGWGDLLTAQERAIAQQLSRRDDLYGRRAMGLLLLDAGATHEDVAQQVDRTPRTVRRWARAFRGNRLACFPNRILRQVQSTPAAILPPVPVPEPGEDRSEGASVPEPEPQPLKALFKRYLVDRARARRVADHALALFEQLLPLHGISEQRRSLLETAAMVYNIGSASDAGRRRVAARDILLTHPPEELDEDERLMVALASHLRDKQVSTKRLKRMLSQDPYASLDERAREEALTLSALVRIADGLDYSQTQSSDLGRVAEEDVLVSVEVVGPYAAVDAARAQEKGDLWRLLFDKDLRFAPTDGGSVAISSADEVRAVEPPVDLVMDQPPEAPRVRADDSMGQAARKVLTFHFQRMLYHEPGTRAGADIEELHDMRVATRRMRSAFRVFGDYVDRKRLKPMRKGANRTCDALGAVRDLDVFWQKTERYLDALPSEGQSDLMPLREAWEAEREQAREEMLAYLDGGRYARFKERSVDVLQRSDAWEKLALTKKGEAVPLRVRHVVPVAVHQRAAAVLAYDEWVGQPAPSLTRLHRLRIAAKRLRYTLEFFEDVLAPQSVDLVKRMKALQDHLGALQDAVVASELLRDFLTWGTWGHRGDGSQPKAPKEPVVAPGVAAYLAAKQIELQELLATFPETWSYFLSPEFKQTVAVVVSPL